ncbi:hypothetical protein V5N11_024523 [Cardamine amara subsp. amara]|uniref:WIYLD domain-containing protein n=1 Tax=Cardamine amara subsp. amara TaxID=228776 RepID=A0ABD1C0R7_CARAN
MPSSNKQKKSGLMRDDDTARDAMRMYGFDELVIDESIKALLEIYGEDGWILIEEGRYDVLLTNCLEKQQIKENENPEKLRADYAIYVFCSWY